MADRKCYVYVIQEVGGYDKPIKIGNAYNPTARMRHFQMGNPATLKTVKHLEYPNKRIAEYVERALHRRFYSRQIRPNGLKTEWFLPDDDLILFIKQLEGLEECYTIRVCDKVKAMAKYLGETEKAIIDMYMKFDALEDYSHDVKNIEIGA